MYKFKKGDKVRVMEASGGSRYRPEMLGKVGCVLDEDEFPSILFSDGSITVFCQGRLEYVNTPESKKSSNVDKMFRIKYPEIGRSGQEYMLLTEKEAMEVYRDLKESLGI